MAAVTRGGAMAAIVCSGPFMKLARNQARVFGVPDLALIVVPHPVGGIAFAEVEARAQQALPQLADILREREQ
jgi:hypothetical protein